MEPSENDLPDGLYINHDSLSFREFGDRGWKFAVLYINRTKKWRLRNVLWALWYGDLFIGPVPLGKCILAMLILLDILL